jgi:rare lipoprotein A
VQRQRPKTSKSRRYRSKRQAHSQEQREGEGSPTGDSESRTTGKACFFSASGNGALTASGDRLHAGELAAAHASFPLGSRVKVTNLANGKAVDVRIVDRFPVSSRIISVSETAARQLGFIHVGTAEVRLELAHDPSQQSGRE